ncbi:MAG: class I SAM-dependent methyltransferase [Bacteroidales bacterium]
MTSGIYKYHEIAKINSIRGPIIEKYIPKGGVGAECGVFKGHFSRILLTRTEPKELHLVDPWYFLDAEWSWSPKNKSTVDALRDVLWCFKKEINNKKVIVDVRDDLDLLKDCPDGYFDWVYIDSSHAYDHTVKELVLLKKKVKSSGIICGDDWRPDIHHRHHGVYKAVNEFISENKYQLIYANDQNLQWFIKKIC